MVWNDLLLELLWHLEEGGATNGVSNIPIPDHRLNNISIIEDEMEHDATTETLLRKTTSVLIRNKRLFFIQYVLTGICN